MAIVLRPHRQFDEKGAIQLRRKLEKVATSSEFESHNSWIVDLSEIQKLDRFGLVVLIEARRFATQTGHRFYLRNVNNSIQGLLQAALLSPEFEIWEKSKHPNERTQGFLDENSQLTTATSQEPDASEVVRAGDRDLSLTPNPLRKTLDTLRSRVNEVAWLPDRQ